jgi:hypothetical protein
MPPHGTAAAADDQLGIKEFLCRLQISQISMLLEDTFEWKYANANRVSLLPNVLCSSLFKSVRIAKKSNNCKNNGRIIKPKCVGYKGLNAAFSGMKLISNVQMGKKLEGVNADTERSIGILA